MILRTCCHARYFVPVITKVDFRGCASGHPDSMRSSIRANVKAVRRMFRGHPLNLWKVGSDEVAINQKAEWSNRDNTVGNRAKCTEWCPQEQSCTGLDL